MTIYPEIIPDIILKTADLWKKIQKHALTKQIDIVETEPKNINVSTPAQLLYRIC